MEKATRERLAAVARAMALIPFHGAVAGQASNLAPVVRPFPGWTLEEAEGLWCAAFVNYCCVEAGFDFPYRPNECKTCHLAGCLGWEEFAAGDQRIEYHKGTENFVPQAGDIVIYDRVFENMVISAPCLLNGFAGQPGQEPGWQGAWLRPQRSLEIRKP